MADATARKLERKRKKEEQTKANICDSCGLEGHMAKDCTVAVYNRCQY